MNDPIWKLIAVAGILAVLAVIILQIILLRKRSSKNANASTSSIEAQDAQQEVSPYSEDESLEAFNAIMEARAALIEIASSPEDESQDGHNLIEAISACCASNQIKLKMTLSSEVHPRISSATVEYIELYGNFISTMSDWKIVLNKQEEASVDNGLFDYMVKFGFDLYKGDPMRQNREQESKFSEITDTHSRVKHQTDSLWAQFHALNDVIDKRAVGLFEEFGWVREKEKEGA